MSMGSLGGIAGSAAGAPLAQSRGSEVDRAANDRGVQEHRVQGQQKAESAAGIGEADGEDHETSERDADGRSPWQMPKRQTPGKTPPDAAPKDPTGESGTQLDLTG